MAVWSLGVCLAGELRALYRESMHLEAAFFGEQPGLPRPPDLGVLVVDFDETCTAADTTGAIIGAAIAEAERRAGGAQRHEWPVAEVHDISWRGN